jgi:hypothetical protein
VRPVPASQQQVMPDDHSESVPPLPIPNRTVKRLHADDSADSRVKVGNRQAPYAGQSERFSADFDPRNAQYKNPR